jgi:hypothetical protein
MTGSSKSAPWYKRAQVCFANEQQPKVFRNYDAWAEHHGVEMPKPPKPAVVVEVKEEEDVVLDSSGNPTTLRPGKKIPLKLKERKQLSRTVVHYSFALPSEEHVMGLPIGQHVYISTKMANPRTGGEKKYITRAYTPISTTDTLGTVDLVIKTYYKDEHPRFPRRRLALAVHGRHEDRRHARLQGPHRVDHLRRPGRIQYQRQQAAL